MRGRAATATCGSTTSATEASHDCIRRPERQEPSASARSDPTDGPGRRRQRRLGRRLGVARARPPQRGRIASDSPHLPADGRPRDWCLGRRDGRGRRLGDDAARPRAVADRSEDEQRQAREPSRPADRRRSRRQRRLGDVAKTMINRDDQGAGLGQSTGLCPLQQPAERRAVVQQRGRHCHARPLSPTSNSATKVGVKHGSDGTRTRAASGVTVLFDR